MSNNRCVPAKRRHHGRWGMISKKKSIQKIYALNYTLVHSNKDKYM
jgi:hypothetical protein